MQIEKDISTGYWIVKQNDLESPIVRAGLANLLYLPAILPGQESKNCGVFCRVDGCIVRTGTV